MAVIAFPAVFRVGGAQFTRLKARAATVSPFSLRRQVLLFPGQLWMARLPLRGHRPAEADAIDAFLLSLISEEHTVQFSGASFHRPEGPAATLDWTLDPGSPTELARSPAGFGEDTVLVFREVV